MPVPPLRALLLAAAAFTLGVALGPLGPGAPIRLAAALLLLLLLLLLDSRAAPASLQAGALLLLFALAGWSAGAPRPLPALPEERVWVEGDVRLPVERSGEGLRLRLELRRWEAGRRSGPLFGTMLVRLDRAPQGIEPGSRLLVNGIPDTLEGAGNPGGYNPAVHWGVRGVELELDGAGGAAVLGVHGFSNRVRAAVGAARGHIRRWIQRTGDEVTRPLAEALLLGDRSGWDRELRTRLARGGMLHLFAISGLHVGLLAFMVHILLRLARLGPRTAWGASLPVVWALVVITGANPPVQRAALMLTLAIGGLLLVRRARPGWALLLAWLVLLAWRPEGLRDAGTQLTFAGAAGALIAARRFESLLHVPRSGTWRNNLRGWLRGGLLALLVSTGAFLATAPFVLWHFGRLPWLAPLVAVAAIPLLTLALAAGWLMVLLSPFPPLAEVLGASHWALLRGMEFLGELAVAFGPVAERLPPRLALPAGGIALLWALLAGRLLRRPLPTLALGGAGTVLLLLAAQLWTLPTDAKLAVLDVGQGDAVLIRGHGRSVLVDAGPPWSTAALEQLRTVGVDTLDLLVLTHGDRDHAGAAAELAGSLPLRAALVGPATGRDEAGRAALAALEQAGVPLFRGADSTRVDLGPLGRIEVLAPGGQTAAGDNDLSLVLLWRVEGRGVLLPGDISARVERELVRGGGLPDVDLLLAAHHGSGSSSSAGWLEALRPEHLAVSCGEHNPYGHPSPEVLARARGVGAKVHRTDRRGALLFRVGPDGVEPIPRWAWWP